MKKLFLLSCLCLSGCFGPIKVQIVPSDDQISELTRVVNNQGKVLEQLLESKKDLIK